MSKQQRPSMLVIDKQVSWRKRLTDALKQAGYEVQSAATYSYPPTEIGNTAKIDLVLLGCVKIGSAEMSLIHQIVEEGHPLLVLSSTLSRPEMRTLFLAGARDVDSKSYDAQHLVATVDQVLRSLKPRDSYEFAKKKGVSE